MESAAATLVYDRAEGGVAGSIDIRIRSCRDRVIPNASKPCRSLANDTCGAPQITGNTVELNKRTAAGRRSLSSLLQKAPTSGGRD